MPRPSMAAQRREEILDALEQCILEDSLEATSLEMLAEKANMKRSILRHYIGNRDDIIVALSERYRDYYNAQWQQTIQWLPDNNRLPAFLDIMFAERNQNYINRSIVGEAIYSQAKRLKDVRDHQLFTMNQSIDFITRELRTAYPEASDESLALVSRGILAAYMNGESFLPLDLNQEIKELKQVCLLLVGTLD